MTTDRASSWFGRIKIINKNKILIIILALATLGWFYWSEIRPVVVRSNCSWMAETIPADPGITREQSEENKKSYEQQCMQDSSRGGVYGRYADLVPVSVKCWTLKLDSQERPPQPEKKEVRSATKSEYDQCLRHKGL